MRSLYRTIDRSDLRDATALAAAVGVVGASYGALAAAAEVSPAIAIGMSVLVLAGGSQFLVVAVVAAGGSPVAAVLGGLLLNARHLPFGLAMSGVVADRWPGRLLGAHILIDEVVAFARARGSGQRARAAYWTCGVLLATVLVAGHRRRAAGRQRRAGPVGVRGGRGLSGGPARAGAARPEADRRPPGRR